MTSRAKKMLQLARTNAEKKSKILEMDNYTLQDRNHHMKRIKPNDFEKAATHDEEPLFRETVQNDDNGEAKTSKNSQNLQDNDQSSSDEFDDSDSDPHFIPTTFNDSSSISSDIDAAEIEKLAGVIESNITNNDYSPLSCIDTTIVGSEDQHAISTSSVRAGQNQHGLPGLITKTIIKPKWKRGKAKEKICMSLKDCKKKCREKVTFEQQLILSINMGNYRCMTYEPRIFLG